MSVDVEKTTCADSAAKTIPGRNPNIRNFIPISIVGLNIMLVKYVYTKVVFFLNKLDRMIVARFSNYQRRFKTLLAVGGLKTKCL